MGAIEDRRQEALTTFQRGRNSLLRTYQKEEQRKHPFAPRPPVVTTTSRREQLLKEARLQHQQRENEAIGEDTPVAFEQKTLQQIQAERKRRQRLAKQARTKMGREALAEGISDIPSHRKEKRQGIR